MPNRLPPPLRIVFFSMLMLSAINCARQLDPNVVFSVPIARAHDPNPAEYIQIEEAGRVPYNLPLRPLIVGSDILVTDTARALVRVYQGSSEEPEYLLGDLDPAEVGGEVEVLPLPAGVPGLLAVGPENQRIYIESRQPATALPDREASPNPPVPPYQRPSHTGSHLDYQPSMILRLNDDYELIGRLGLEGYESDRPFPQIFRLHAHADDVVSVLHTMPGSDERVLSIYSGGRLRQRLRGSEVYVPTAEDRQRHHVEVEDIAPGLDASFAISSIAIRNRQDYSLVARILLRTSLSADGQTMEIYRSDDPERVFAGARPDGGFVLMTGEEDGSQVLFRLFGPEGEYVKNLLVSYPGLLGSWRETFVTLDEKFFSTRLFLGRFELYEWK